MTTTDQYGRTGLHNATIDRDMNVLATLIQGSADVNAQDKNGWTALHFAAQNVDDEAAQLLIASGASVELSDANGNTPLHTAVFNSRGDGSVISLLRAAGAKHDHENTYGMTPLKLARTIANFDVMQFFSDVAPQNSG